jgi:hypothetical protein
VGWIEKTPNMNTNLLFNHATGNGIVNELDTRGLRTLKVSMDEICEKLVKTRYRRSSYENGLMSKSFCKYHKQKGHMIDQCEDFHNELI